MRIQEDDNNDYFDGPDIPDTPERKEEPPVKKPSYRPDDPRYWEEPESEFEHLRPDPENRIWWWIAGAGIVIGLLIAAYIRWFQPYSESAVQYGYVESVEYRGTFFKTYEGVILPYKNIMDTTRVYEGDFVFSTSSPEAAITLRKMQYANRPVRVVYKTYRSVMPWRGDARHIIVAADSVDPSKILPPDRQPKF